MQTKRTMRLASPGRRLVAALIDAVPIAVSKIVLAAYFGAMVSASVRSAILDNYGFAGGTGLLSGNAALSTAMVLFFGSLLILWCGVQLYFLSRSQTLGKALLGLQVIEGNDGMPAGMWKMLLRELLGKKASGVLCGLGYLWILIDSRHRGWHDKIFETYVIDLRETAAMAAATISAIPAETDREISLDRTPPVAYNEEEKYYSHKWQ